MDATRRKLLKAALLGAGGLGLRGLAGSLPAGLLAGPSRAAAADACGAQNLPSGAPPQRIVLITSASGDPLNANVPGMYLDPNIYHPPDRADDPDRNMTPTTFTLGGASVIAAKPWADLGTLAPGILDHTCFFHHATYSNAHGDHAKVNALMGAIRRQELLVSLLAKNLAPCLGTKQPQPVVLSSNLIRYQGAVLPMLSRSGLAQVLGAPAADSDEAKFRPLRDADVGRLNELLRAGATPAQQAAIDRYADAQAQARAVDPALVAGLDDTTANAPEQHRVNSAAVALLAMNVSPVVVLNYDWGGDNHADGGLYTEATQTVASVRALADLWNKIQANQALRNGVTIVCQNVFGRTLNAANRGGNRDGRDHNSAHHCSVLIGPGFKPGVIGGVAPIGNEFRCEAINSATGAADPAGDIPYEMTLAAMGKTLGAACGVTRAAIDDQIPDWNDKTIKYVEAALA